MKKVFFYVQLLIVAVAFAACASNDEPMTSVENSDGDPVVQMAKYTNVVVAHKDLIADFCIANEDHSTDTRSVGSEIVQSKALNAALLPAAKEFTEEIDISRADLQECGLEITSEEDYENAMVATMLLATELEQMNTPTVIYGGSFKECFLEATGIAAGVVLVGGLANGAISQTVLKTCITKILSKTVLRSINGIGLALIAGEIAWCMY